MPNGHVPLPRQTSSREIALKGGVEPATPPKPALFLDRDGVINVDRGYVYKIEDFQLIEGAADIIRRFNTTGWLVFVVTNQSGIARGYYTEDQMHALHAHMESELEKRGARVDAIYYCPYHEEGEIAAYRRDSDLRKPRPGMLLEAMADFAVDKSRSFLIGDKDSDIEAARAAGLRGFLFPGDDLVAFTESAMTAMGLSQT